MRILISLSETFKKNEFKKKIDISKQAEELEKVLNELHGLKLTAEQYFSSDIGRRINLAHLLFLEHKEKLSGEVILPISPGITESSI